MLPRRVTRAAAARGAAGDAVRGAVRGARRGRGARGGRIPVEDDPVDSLVGSAGHSVEQQGSGININVPPEAAPAVGGQNADLQSKLFERFLKRNPPRFERADTPIQALEFLRDLESIFAPMGIPGEMKATFAAYQLFGAARDWWENVHESLVAAGQTPVTWEQFAASFRKSFCLRVHMSALERELIQMRQEGRSITEYERRFSELCRLLPEINTGEDKRIERFRDGMDWEIRTRLSLLRYTSFVDLLNDAIQVEMELVERSGRGEKRVRQDFPGAGVQPRPRFQTRPRQRGRFSQGQFRAPIPITQVSGAGAGSRSVNLIGGSQGDLRGRCYSCGRQGHVAAQCPDRAIICYRCRQPGHISSQCPQSPDVGGGVNPSYSVQPSRGGLSGSRGGLYIGRGGSSGGAGTSRGGSMAGTGPE